MYVKSDSDARIVRKLLNSWNSTDTLEQVVFDTSGSYITRNFTSANVSDTENQI